MSLAEDVVFLPWLYQKMELEFILLINIIIFISAIPWKKTIPGPVVTTNLLENIVMLLGKWKIILTMLIMLIIRRCLSYE